MEYPADDVMETLVRCIRANGLALLEDDYQLAALMTDKGAAFDKEVPLDDSHIKELTEVHKWLEIRSVKDAAGGEIVMLNPTESGKYYGGKWQEERNRQRRQRSRKGPLAMGRRK